MKTPPNQWLRGRFLFQEGLDCGKLGLDQLMPAGMPML
jgi:hypothetical protein